ncbi:MAG: exopolysaccharide Pel transporter PelG [Bulleidia sp.]|nr:exopolysaccharide Pel transporter PelG [Bulleidia sp.]
MAGIGFELNKLFKEKGISAKARAFGTSSVILAGPLLMGIALIILLLNFAEGQGMSQEGRNLLVVMITYATLGSLFITGVISLPLTRYVSDMMYLGKNRRIIPALLGSISIVLPAGCALYLILLVRSDLSLAVIFLNLALLAEISAIFLVNGFLTAIRNYKGLLGSYAASLAITLVFVWILTQFFAGSVTVFLTAVVIGYGVQLLAELILLYDFFPVGNEGYYDFLPWVKHYWKLVVSGTAMNVGLFGHMFITWNSSIGQQVQGSFISAPEYDIPSLYGYLATLVSTVYFVTAAETRFFTRYHRYYSSLNTQATAEEVDNARQDMLSLMWHDCQQCAVLQGLCTLVMLSVGLIFFEQLQPGFNLEMKAYYEALCVGYGLFAIANVLNQYSTYYTDYTGVVINSLVFAGSTTLLTYLTAVLDLRQYFGLGFAAGCLLFLISSFLRLKSYTADLNYEVLSLKPFVQKDWMTEVIQKISEDEEE